MIRAVIIDDEPSCVVALAGLLFTYCPEIQLEGKADSVEEGVKLIHRSSPEVVFLDVNLANETGFDLLKHFPEPKFRVIFCTAFDKYAIQAFRVSAFDYLLKPINPEELIECVKRLRHHIENAVIEIPAQRQILDQNLSNPNPTPDSLIISSANAYHFVQLESIEYLQADGGYTTFFLADKTKITTSKNLVFYREILDEDLFLQCHKSYIINTSYILKYIKGEGGIMVMRSGAEIPVSARKKEEVMKKFKHFKGI